MRPFYEFFDELLEICRSPKETEVLYIVKEDIKHAYEELIGNPFSSAT